MITVYGAAYSTYVRTVRLALEEKGQAYSLAEVDIFKPVPPEHLQRHPWGKIPVLDHDGFLVYETTAITRYVDEAFEGPHLQGETAHARAVEGQVMGIIDSYGYAPIVAELFVQRTVTPMLGGTSDESRIEAAVPKVRKVLDVLEQIRGDGPFLAGTAFGVADVHAIPVFTYLRMTPEGVDLMHHHPRLSEWFAHVHARPSVAATKSPLEG